MDDERKAILDRWAKAAAARIMRAVRMEALRTGQERREVIAELAAETAAEERASRLRRKFGSLPSEYDPEQDPDHPSRGWKPEGGDDA